MTDYYEDTGEQKLVCKAIAKARGREREYSTNSIDFDGSTSSKFDTMRYVYACTRYVAR